MDERDKLLLVKIGALYKHFKGHVVRVIALGRHSETRDWYVVYEKTEDGDGYKKGDVWIRPKDMFLGTIERDGKKFLRFELVE
jgi:cyclomaltodextrinase / maltogenic alpha-amylase / neopullulanase